MHLISDIQTINLPKILDDRGNLSFLENLSQLPFEIKRVYWIYDVPGGEVRGGHAFKQQNEVLVVLSGSVDIVVHDGHEEQRFSLNRSYIGLYVPNMLWRHIENFSTNAVVLVVSDTVYAENDYLRDFEEYKLIKNGK
ncbi:FdtA/QdtA family cupin domain-containing protein [Chitinophaga pendula]|uniref:sugar 3,4-ketoisomerase n=1 Tax=Chitinophaga TaxID=79328 RepID=UPI000BAF04A8|nr:MULTISPECIES: FdtA/QdtA family cupin domain-containing protein [Chitinophaga]ASZ10689.1 hypothetical protein CK934_06690 [Chitinophaga sp. MD30]UCJ06338.1 FdtA/QdtA family cupin domain-containing protein [Chitinophaga pendula]